MYCIDAFCKTTLKDLESQRKMYRSTWVSPEVLTSPRMKLILGTLWTVSCNSLSTYLSPIRTSASFWWANRTLACMFRQVSGIQEFKNRNSRECASNCSGCARKYLCLFLVAYFIHQRNKKRPDDEYHLNLGGIGLGNGWVDAIVQGRSV